jgi:hypothetical protein
MTWLKAAALGFLAATALAVWELVFLGCCLHPSKKAHDTSPNISRPFDSRLFYGCRGERYSVLRADPTSHHVSADFIPVMLSHFCSPTHVAIHRSVTRRRFVLSVLLVHSWCAALAVAPRLGRLDGIDLSGGTLTVRYGNEFTTFRFRPSVSVTLNGQRSSIDQLRIGTSISVRSDEPGLASQITTTAPLIAVPKTKRPALEQTLAEKLVGTVWSWPNPAEKKDRSWFRLNPDGTTTAGWHNELRSWRVLSADTAEIVAMHNKTPQTLHFNATATEATLDGHPNVIYKRISPKP